MTNQANPAAETAKKAKDTAETALKNGAEAFKNGMENAVKGYDQFLGFGKENVEAYLRSANATGKGVETLQNELYLFSKQSVEETLATTKAVLGAKTVHEALEIQADFAKTAFEAYVGQVNRLNEIMLSTAKDALEPIQHRIHALANTAQTARAA